MSAAALYGISAVTIVFHLFVPYRPAVRPGVFDCLRRLAEPAIKQSIGCGHPRRIAFAFLRNVGQGLQCERAMNARQFGNRRPGVARGLVLCPFGPA